ncbi:MAG: hemolysin-type calcium-binding protein, partial [Rhodocyclaceae bacterium]
LTTGTGNDKLLGGEGNDILIAGAGHDHLNGNGGADTLTGGAGNDQFIIDNLAGVDTITDFSAVDDAVFLVGADFGNYVADRAARFKLTTGTLDADDRILYSPTTGAVYYDADGNGAAAAVQFATLSGAPAASYQNFYLNPTNAPILVADSVVTAESSPVTIDVLANDYLPAGWKLRPFLTYSVSASSGSVASNAEGQLVFTPGTGYETLDPGQYGTATITYSVWNETTFASMQGTVNVTLTGETELQAGTAGNDTLIGTAYGDTLLGNAGNDALIGHGGNDTLTGGAGNDALEGGGGSDTAIFTGNFAGYTVTSAGIGRATVVDNTPGRDGTDALGEIEILQFADGPRSVSSFLPSLAATLNLTTAQSDEIRSFFDG